MTKILKMILVALCVCAAPAESQEEKIRFTNFEDLRWIVTNASKIGSRVTTIPTYPHAGDKSEPTWLIKCYGPNSMGSIKLGNNTQVLFPLIEVIIGPPSRTHMVAIKGWMSRPLKLQDKTIEIRGVFNAAMKSHGETLDIGIPRVDGTLQSYEDMIHNEQNAVRALDALVADCRKMHEEKLKK